MLNWVNRFNIFCFLDNCDYRFTEPAFDCLVATGSKRATTDKPRKAFQNLDEFLDANKEEWIFGHLGYDLKNENGSTQSELVDGIGFDDLFFFIPEIILQLGMDHLTIYADTDAEIIFRSILECPGTIQHQTVSPVQVNQRIPRDEYIGIINKLREHILRGDCYEINFCQEFYAEDAVIDPLYTYWRLTERSPNPFSAFYRINNKYCFSASPERYLAKSGERIYSQPIKGTSKRNLVDAEKDEANKQYLLQSNKEKSENVMVVDLVRNDLSRVCVAGTVQVDELFGLYSFPQLHQMISTVSGILKPGIPVSELFRSSFPMGSMTGAPKIRVMQLIEQYEQTRRGLFSGAIGYFKPVPDAGHDFDFNVVIRSMMYNASSQYLSFQTGSGITFYSDPENEYEECLLKATAMLEILK